MKVAVVGAQRSGKTTLAKNLRDLCVCEMDTRGAGLVIITVDALSYLSQSIDVQPYTEEALTKNSVTPGFVVAVTKCDLVKKTPVFESLQVLFNTFLIPEEMHALKKCVKRHLNFHDTSWRKYFYDKVSKLFMYCI